MLLNSVNLFSDLKRIIQYIILVAVYLIYF
jgi:hypothetical protein